MTVLFNILFQLAAFITQGANMFTSIVPDKYKGILFLVVGFAQVLVAYRSHFFNPDGTPAAVAYIKPPKQ